MVEISENKEKLYDELCELLERYETTIFLETTAEIMGELFKTIINASRDSKKK
ncbi:MAG: hypothetical protein FWC29_05575 [Methanomassiliicoccaceae archaeon]|nr:hypothetical protein [Methanomassiliicoccaceae archaeon]